MEIESTPFSSARPPSSAPFFQHLRRQGRREASSVQSLNTLLGNLKSAISGTYHAFNFAKYAHRYLAEHQYRFNRRFDMQVIFKRLLVALVRAPVRTERHLRLAEVAR
ncbi:MAG TPA: transposase [Burkholderiales bacterium]|nr:transposase [Burkholderiales bacterium]